MSLDPELIRRAIERDDAAGVRDLLRQATEAERRACARALDPLLAGSADGAPFPEGWFQLARRLAFQAAAFGLAPGAIPAGRHAYLLSRILSAAELEILARVLDDRRPPWLASFVDRRLAARNAGPDAWVIARRLVALGAIERPAIPEYTTRMLVALRRFALNGPTMSHVDPLRELLADPGLLEDEVWRLFTTPGVTRGLEPGSARRPGWEDALAALAGQGRLDGGRLLDACLDALGRDLAPDEPGWYLALHDRLDPSLDEMAARASTYACLLAVSAKAVVTFAQQACGRLLAAGRLPAEDFLAASAPALLFPGKAVAAAQLRLIGTVVAARPQATDLSLAAAAEAFGHQRLDVQEAALDLIARYGLPEGPEREVISERAARLAPALEHRAISLGLPARSPAPPASPTILADGPVRTEPGAGDRLPLPLADPGELIQLLTQLMEDAPDPLAVERAVAGAVRLCGLPVAERARLAAPLLKRAEERLHDDYDGPFGGREIRSDIAGLTLAWGRGWTPGSEDARRVWGWQDRQAVLRSGQARTMAGILTARIWEASALVAAGRPAELLAEPEFRRGAISPDRLIGRLGSWASRPLSRHDLEIALLRLAPGTGDSFWSAWARLHPSSRQAAQHAYQQGLAPLGFEPVIWRPGTDSGLPGPAPLARLTAPAGPAGSRCWALLTALSDPGRDFYRDHAYRHFMGPGYRPVVAGWPALCPWQPELAAAHLLRPLSDSLRPGAGRAGTAAAALGGLSPSGHALGEIGHLAVAAGLASAEPYVRIAAAEVWVKACRDGRLDPQLAARAIVTGVTGEAFKLNRVADGLQHASHDPVAAQRIVQTVFATADDLIPAKPSGLHLLLGLAARAGTPAAVPAAITTLAAGPNRSQLVTAARRLAGAAP